MLFGNFVYVLELPVAIRVSAALQRFCVGLKAVAEFAEHLRNATVIICYLPCLLIPLLNIPYAAFYHYPK